jgi:hypothetical protein
MGAGGVLHPRRRAARPDRVERETDALEGRARLGDAAVVELEGGDGVAVGLEERALGLEDGVLAATLAIVVVHQQHAGAHGALASA